MPIMRKTVKDKYTIIPNVGLEDPTLSAKAKGLLSYMLSKSDNWSFYQQELEQHFTDGRDAIKSGIQELISHGYISKSQAHTSDSGRFDKVDWIVYDLPQTENPSTVQTPVNQQSKNENAVKSTFSPQTGLPLTDKPLTENPQLPITDITNNGFKPITDITNGRLIIGSEELLYSSSTENDKNRNKNNNKNESISKYEDPVTLWRTNAELNQNTLQQLVDWLDDFKDLSGDDNQANGIVSLAIHQALDAGAVNMAYLNTVLRNWKTNKVISVEQAQQAQENHKQAYKKNTNYSSDNKNTSTADQPNYDLGF